MKLIKDGDMWRLAQGSGRHVSIEIRDDVLAFQNIYFGTAQSLAHLKGKKRRTWYGRIIDQSDREIEFEPLTANEVRCAGVGSFWKTVEVR